MMLHHGPFRASLHRDERADGSALIIRLDEFQDGMWVEAGRYDLPDLWWIIPALQDAQTRAISQLAGGGSVPPIAGDSTRKQEAGGVR